VLEAGHFETRETLLLLQASSFWPSGASSSLKEATYLLGHGAIDELGRGLLFAYLLFLSPLASIRLNCSMNDLPTELVMGWVKKEVKAGCRKVKSPYHE